MTQFYNKRWDGVRKQHAEKHNKNSNQIPLKYLKRVEAGDPQKEQNILDVGAGYGKSIRAFLDDGYKNISAIEHSEKRASSLANNFDINTEHCSLENFSLSDTYAKTGNFDFIYLWHVFEHMTDVKTNLRILYNLLSDDGHIFLAVPNFYREPIIWLAQSPVHQHSFSASNLFRIAQDEGFSVKILDQGYDAAGLILVAQKQKLQQAKSAAPPEFTRQEIVRKLIRDLDLDSGHHYWKASEPLLLQLFTSGPASAHVMKSEFLEIQFPRLAYFLYKSGLERRILSHRKLPEFSLIMALENYTPMLCDYIYDQVCVKQPIEKQKDILPTVNFMYDNDCVQIWLR
jgi:2-polyprenyl-3-methyl-5-hydroxy-6-metoxy-1,4-benzoquinol methylase